MSSMKIGGGMRLGSIGGIGGISMKLAKPPEKVKDPLADVPVTGDDETDARAELDATAIAFRERRAREEKRFDRATDTEFWFAAVFHTREQKEAFLTALALLADGDKYVDGLKLAAKLGITLPE